MPRQIIPRLDHKFAQQPFGRCRRARGLVWDSTSRTAAGSAISSLTCGSAAKGGICFFADSDNGWVTNIGKENQSPCLTLTRKDGVLTLGIHLVQKAITLTEPRTIVLELMASPAEAMLDDWRTSASQPLPGQIPLVWMGSNTGAPMKAFPPSTRGTATFRSSTPCGNRRKNIDVEKFVTEWSARNIEVRPTPNQAANGRGIQGVGKVSLGMAAAAKSGFVFQRLLG